MRPAPVAVAGGERRGVGGGCFRQAVRMRCACSTHRVPPSSHDDVPKRPCLFQPQCFGLCGCLSARLFPRRASQNAVLPVLCEQASLSPHLPLGNHALRAQLDPQVRTRRPGPAGPDDTDRQNLGVNVSKRAAVPRAKLAHVRCSLSIPPSSSPHTRFPFHPYFPPRFQRSYGGSALSEGECCGWPG